MTCSGEHLRLWLELKAQTTHVKKDKEPLNVFFTRICLSKQSLPPLHSFMNNFRQHFQSHNNAFRQSNSFTSSFFTKRVKFPFILFRILSLYKLSSWRFRFVNTMNTCSDIYGISCIFDNICKTKHKNTCSLHEKKSFKSEMLEHHNNLSNSCLLYSLSAPKEECNDSKRLPLQKFCKPKAPFTTVWFF